MVYRRIVLVGKKREVMKELALLVEMERRANATKVKVEVLKGA